MAKLQSIGSVVAIDGRRYVVIGHRMVQDGENVGAGYVRVPYPLGFSNIGSLSVVPASRAADVVAEGFANDAGSAHLAYLGELVEALSDIPYSEYESSVQLLRDFSQEGGANG